MRNIQPGPERSRAIHALSEAFIDNQSARQIAGIGRNRAARLRRLIEYALAESEAFGQAVCDDSGNAFALLIYPEQVKISLSAVLRKMMFLLLTIRLFKLFKILDKEQRLKQLKAAHFGTGKLAHLWFIGVAPAGQRKGCGTALLREIMADAATDNRKLVLETSTEANLSFYWKAGLECYDILEQEFTLYCFCSED